MSQYPFDMVCDDIAYYSVHECGGNFFIALAMCQKKMAKQRDQGYLETVPEDWNERIYRKVRSAYNHSTVASVNAPL